MSADDPRAELLERSRERGGEAPLLRPAVLASIAASAAAMRNTG
ncbi:hypothetical protein [Pseudohaliea rubra]|uniref:Uncharacterized protein n=1 Tax=Pseudohaliea rubra DSM 19751 TaxID=1265313 RepID=A0A095VS12_9GAMM|nr:hypothetical protein [Pseudohaliea rubra]KGE04145.1 hypothetical protein HRUBRA_01240 [Pseudohaliea rubra DSM 19751]